MVAIISKEKANHKSATQVVDIGLAGSRRHGLKADAIACNNFMSSDVGVQTCGVDGLRQSGSRSGGEQERQSQNEANYGLHLCNCSHLLSSIILILGAGEYEVSFCELGVVRTEMLLSRRREEDFV
jgi:hypothetical protein